MLPHYMLELRHVLESYLTPDQVRQVEKAFVIGERAHRGQNRKSGEPYIQHPLAVAGILADIAPTLLDMLGVKQPAEMTGKSLLVRK